MNLGGIKRRPVVCAAVLCAVWGGFGMDAAHADKKVGVATEPVGSHCARDCGALEALRSFARQVHSGQGRFKQTVITVDGRRKRQTVGKLAFERPNRFRFAYSAPSEQLMVADGHQLWMFDVDLNQVVVRPMGAVLDATPAAILAGSDIEREFVLSAAHQADCLGPGLSSTGATADAHWQWVQARPKQSDGTLQWLCIGLSQGQPAVLVMRDSFGQQSRLDLIDMQWQVHLPASTFEFTPPAGADVMHQQ